MSPRLSGLLGLCLFLALGWGHAAATAVAEPVAFVGATPPSPSLSPSSAPR
jgi:hypothetical protein